MFPRHYRPEVYTAGLNVRGQRVSARLNYGRLIQPGQRAVTVVETGVAVVFSDEDGDGYDETATVVAATTLTDVNEVKVFFAGENGAQEWEIRHPRSKEITGGVFTATFFSWQLIDPDLWFALTGGLPATQAKLSPLKLTNSIYVSTVDVYREFPDFTQPSAKFFFENRPINLVGAGQLDFCVSCNGTGCGACELRIQDGCFFPRNVDEGVAVPVPADFDTATGEWVEQRWIDCRAADQVRLSYYAGDIDNRFLSGATTDPLKLYWAEAITWLTVARLPRPMCSCGSVEKEVGMLRRDMRFTEPDGRSAILSDSDLNNPFGTRMGEVRAWKRVNTLARKRAKVAVI